jgi:hypothetical protein
MRRERIRIMNIFNTILLNRNSLTKEMVCARLAVIASWENNCRASVYHMASLLGRRRTATEESLIG